MNPSRPFPSGSVRTRVEAFLASPAWRGSSGLASHSVDPLAAAMNRAAGVTDADVAEYGGITFEVRRQLGLGPRTIVTHAVGLIAGTVTESCADCIDAVSQLGAREDAIPSLVQT